MIDKDKRIAELEKALEFYANASNYEDTYNGCSDPECCSQDVVWMEVVSDAGETARKVLGKVPK